MFEMRGEGAAMGHGWHYNAYVSSCLTWMAARDAHDPQECLELQLDPQGGEQNAPVKVEANFIFSRIDMIEPWKPKKSGKPVG